MKYRDHRGSLSDSMETVQEFDTFEDLKEYLEYKWRQMYYVVEQVKIEPYGFDERIDWDTHIVTVQLKDVHGQYEYEGKFIPVGWTDGNFNP